MALFQSFLCQGIVEDEKNDVTETFTNFVTF